MPQPINGECDLHYHPKIVLERPRHAEGIGLVASEWAALEEQLILMFTYALFKDGSMEVSETTHVAWRAWDAMESLKARLDFIESVSERRMDAELFAEFVGTIKPEIRKRAQERNRIVHGHWNTCNQFPDDIILWVPGGKHLRYSQRDFHDIADRIIDTSNRISEFWNRVSVKRWFPKPESRQSPEQ